MPIVRAPFGRLCLLLLVVSFVLPSAQAQEKPGALSVFDPKMTGLSEANAYLCMWASRIAVLDFDQVSKFLGKEGWGFDQVLKIENVQTETQGFVGVSDTMILVVFRATEDKLKDWLTDVRFFPRSTPLGKDVKVHQGFDDALSSVWPQVMKHVNANLLDANGKVKPVWITGHSLGGALGTLAAVRLKKERPDIETLVLYNFASPRVGNQAFANLFQTLNIHSFRFVYQEDVVPWVPFHIPFLVEFAPVSDPIRLDMNGLNANKNVPHTTLDYMLRYIKAVSVGKGKGLDVPLKDHGTSGYLRSLFKVIMDAPTRDRLPSPP